MSIHETKDTKEVKFEKTSRDKIMQGANLLADAVKITLGPKGRNVVLKNMFGGTPRITKDGVTVAEHVMDRYDTDVNAGIQILKDAARKTARMAGDGTTTSTVLAQALLQKGNDLMVERKSTPKDLHKGMRAAYEDIVDLLKEKARPISSYEDIQRVGTLSANGDKTIGTIFADGFEKVGLEGAMTIAPSATGESYINFVDGMKLDKGWANPCFMNQFSENSKRMTCEFHNPYILVWGEKLPIFTPLIPIITKIVENNRPFVIIVDKIDGEGLSQLILGKTHGKYQPCVIEAPYVGQKQKDVLRDICALTGARYLDMSEGIKLEKIDLGFLGSCERFIADDNESWFIKGKGSDEEKKIRAAHLDSLLAECDEERLEERKFLEKRSGMLKTGIALAYIGGTTQVEIEEKMDRADDAMHAVKAALQEGVVPGGGFTFTSIAHYLENIQNRKRYRALENSSQKAGYECVIESITRPCEQILINGNHDVVEILAIVENYGLEKNENITGFDSDKEEYCDLMERGIMDPAKVLRYALEDAISVVNMILSTACILGDEKLDEAALPGMKR